jgi:hypothetical protein
VLDDGDVLRTYSYRPERVLKAKSLQAMFRKGSEVVPSIDDVHGDFGQSASGKQAMVTKMLNVSAPGWDSPWLVNLFSSA